MEKEIVGGIKNALDRGESLEKAKQSFVNAGYEKSEVEKAAQGLSTFSDIQQPTASKKKTPLPTIKDSKVKKPSKKLKIILFSLGIIFLILLGLVIYLWDKPIF